MADEREEKITELENLNELLKPKKFVEYKAQLENKEKYLKILDTENLQKDIDILKLKLQKTFLKCFEQKIEKAQTKQEILKLIYEFRYYCMLPYDYEKNINETEALAQEIEKIGKKLLQYSHKMKVIEKLSKQEDIDYKLLKNIFNIRNINLEEITIKLTKEKEKYFIQFFDDNAFEEKIEMQGTENLNKRDLAIRFNKKVKIFC